MFDDKINTLITCNFLKLTVPNVFLPPGGRVGPQPAGFAPQKVPPKEMPPDGIVPTDGQPPTQQKSYQLGNYYYR